MNLINQQFKSLGKYALNEIQKKKVTLKGLVQFHLLKKGIILFFIVKFSILVKIN